MLSFFQKSLRNKLLGIFIGIGFLPFITLLIYTLFLSETKIVNKIVIEQLERTKVVIKLIDNHINSLRKEVNFLSSLDLMDDLLADDIDKRISRLLTQKSDDLNLDITFMIVSYDSSIIASSNKEYLQQKQNIKRANSADGIYIDNKELHIYSKIYATFDKTKELGILILKYNLENLDLYLTYQESIHSYIINPKTDLKVGEDLSLDIDFNNSINSIIDDEHVVVYEKLSSVLKDWYIVYAVDKSVALEFLYDFIRFMLYMSTVIFIIILYISFRHSKEIVKPIEKLTIITDDIIRTQNYSARLRVNTQDEIATLTHSFNNMLKTTSSALNELEEENKLRLKRFTQLIEVFNTIIQTKSENECMDISISEIKKLTNKDDLYFTKDKSHIESKKYIDLYVTDFENDRKKYFGSIELGIDNFKDKNEKKLL